MYMRNALTGHSNAKAGSASSEGSACRFTTAWWEPWALGVERYTDVTVRYVPRFRGHGLIRFRYNREKKIYYARFLFIYFEQTVVQITIFST